MLAQSGFPPDPLEGTAERADLRNCHVSTGDNTALGPDSQGELRKFGEKLRFLRTQSDLTLMQLADRIGLRTHSYLSELESGRKLPTAEMVLRISRLFDVSTDSLLKDELQCR